MPQKIKILRASTAASVPPVTLEQGELAVNALASPPELWTRGASGLVNLIESVDLQTVLADYLPLTGGTLSGPGNLRVDGSVWVTTGAIYANEIYANEYVSNNGVTRWRFGSAATPPTVNYINETGGVTFSMSSAGASFRPPLTVFAETSNPSIFSVQRSLGGTLVDIPIDVAGATGAIRLTSPNVTLTGPGNLNVFGRTELKGDVQIGELANPRSMTVYGPFTATQNVGLGNVGYEVNLHGSAQIWNAFTIRSAAVFNCSAPYTQTISSDGDTGAYTSGKIQVRNLIGSGAGAGTLRLPGYGRVFTIDTITGQIADLKAEFGVPLQLAGNATQPLHAVPLQQLNAAIAGIAGGGASVTVSVTAPVNPTEGDLWFDSTDTQLYVRYGTAWVVSANMIGPDRAISGGTF